MSAGLARQLVDTAKSVPRFALGWPDRWLIRTHSPVKTGLLETPAVCSWCSRSRRMVSWPCIKYIHAAERIHHKTAPDRPER